MNPTQSNTGSMSLEQFGQHIQEKYPQYKSMDAKEVANKVIAKYPQYQSKVTQPSPTSEPGFIERVGSAYKKAGEDIYSSMQAGAEKYQKGVQEGGVSGIAKATGGLLESGLRTAGGVAGAAFAPITEAAKPIVQPVVEKLAQIPGVKGGIDALSSWATQHPDAAKNLEAAMNIATLGVGGAVEKPTIEAAKAGLEAGKSVVGAAGEALKLGAKGIAEKAGSAVGKIESKIQNKAFQDLVDTTSGVADKKARISALEQTGAIGKEGKALGGTKQTLLGGVKTAPDAMAVERAKAVEGIVKPKASPVENLANLNKEISRISEKEVAPALDKAGSITPISEKTPGWSSIVQRMNDIPKPDIITADPTLDKTYDLVRNRMIEQIQKQPPTVKGLWDARKGFDEMVKKQFGDVAFDSEKNTAIKRAVSDMRRTVNDIIGEKVPEYKTQMDKLSNMYDARYNIAEQFQDIVDKGGLTAFKKLNPKTYSALKWGLITGVGVPGLHAVTGI